jgi:hypothetical protein
MGSFTPWGAACCVTGSCWGTFTSVLIIASPPKLIAYFFKLTVQTIVTLDDRDQFGRLVRGTLDRLRLFPHM